MNGFSQMINVDNLKKRGQLFIAGCVCIGLTWLDYCSSITGVMDLLMSRSIVYYFWGHSSIILFIPVLVYFDFLFVFACFSYNLKLPVILGKGLIISYYYAGAAFIIGNIISFVVIFYPLGTNYVQCLRSGPLAGTYYARTEQICEQMKEAWDNGGVKAVNELNDKLDSIPPHQ